ETTIANNARINTFVREDWLKALSLPEPTTKQEFEDMLVAFRDNADLLLGSEANRMIPFSMSDDVGWQTNNLLISFAPDGISQRDRYVYGYDDRQLLWPGNKEGVRLLNKWYNMDLIYPEFALVTGSDSTVTDLVNAGYVGAYLGNWDIPYRGTNPAQIVLQQQRGEEAAFIAVDPFENDAGNKVKVLGGAFDRKIFFPMTNDEPKASIFYVDFLSRPEVIQFLQLGIEGVNYDIVDGIPHVKSAVATLKDDEGKDVLGEDGMPIIIDDTNRQYIINSPQNIDYTLPINGYYPEGLTAAVTATSFVGIDPSYILRALEKARNDGLPGLNLNIGEIPSEAGVAAVLREKRNTLYANAIRATVDGFDKAYDDGLAEYMANGGQAIIDERRAAYDRAFGADSD
ncbi:MAG: sugar ABC transporter substrate-binding protein, partial [Oscillospiraceae bacterium]|nr:sugar ABC transporter substrate-binding protein [Oscillospiraceae bacterium]